ncbi:MAG: NAD(P)(+) transhydrogenase (Re/Si-specific) subunit alpha [Thalassobius sp.]|nr:NAD(P)(+) transhydrogenase (Re/Si-specific) subunit alpha [Thalassovita sp.]
MKIGVLREEHDSRVALIPDIVSKFVKDGVDILVEKEAGAKAFFDDMSYAEAGGKILTKSDLIKESDVLISINPPSDLTEFSGKVLISSFQPFNSVYPIEKLAELNIQAFSMDMIPRTTLAQAMDVLSSMASVAGYRAVLKAAELLPRYFPMLTTAAGSIPPSKVLILGAGVAGLQAIATAKRLGAVVEAFDTRLAAKEEVMSLGAKFVEVEGANDDKAAGGYAVEQTEEYKIKQKALIKEHIIKSDVVITTAQLRGKPAPKLITKEMVELMRPGSVIIDLASSTGGNCELTVDQNTIKHGDVTIFGDSELSAEMPMHASQLYSKNIYNYVSILIKEKEFTPDFNNEIVSGSCIVYNGKVLYGNPEEAKLLAT